MSRQARVVAEAVPHHVTQRGNNRQDIFLTDDDRRFYIDLLRDRCEMFGVSLLGYCLMTNHVHFIAVPRRADSLAKALGQTHWRYAMRFNRRYRRSGHLWQNRFYSCPLNPSHLLTALAYVDLNPVRAGLVGEAGEYPWSSAGAHLEGQGLARPARRLGVERVRISGRLGGHLAERHEPGEDRSVEDGNCQWAGVRG